MHLPLYLLIPLACAGTYVFAALMFKRAAELGVGVWRTAFIANWTVCLVFVPFWFAAGRPVRPLLDYWQPATTALLFMAGQIWLLLALKRGDVSITTPVMGTKVIVVALCASMLRAGDVPLKWWIGASLSAAAVLLLQLGEKRGQHRQLRATALLAGASAASYGLSDALLQKWIPAWGVNAYVPAMFFSVGIGSLLLIPFFSAPLQAMSGQAWRWVTGGSLLMAVNNAGVVIAIGIGGGATAVNIVYSLRGLMSVIVVWAIGHWFTHAEQRLTARVFRYRLLGAGLMVLAVVLVLV